MTENVCTKCNSANIYQDRELWNCPECFHEWNDSDVEQAVQTDDIYLDANGNTLADGDTVTLAKELKVKGATSAIKIGTKVKNIKLGDYPNAHNIICKIDNFGSMYLKTEFVKKS